MDITPGDVIKAARGGRSYAVVAQLLAARGVSVTRGAIYHWTTGARPIPVYAVDPLADVLGMDERGRGILRAAAMAHVSRAPQRGAT